jgi:hypothetical protein
VGIDQFGFTLQRHRHRVDGEVAPGEVLTQRRRLHLGQRPRTRIGLGARGGQVDLEVSQHGLGGSEALMLDHLTTQPPGDLRRVTLDHDVHVAAGAAQQQIPDRAPDEVDRGSGRGLAEAVQLGDRPRDGAAQIGLRVA